MCSEAHGGKEEKMKEGRKADGWESGGWEGMHYLLVKLQYPYNWGLIDLITHVWYLQTLFSNLCMHVCTCVLRGGKICEKRVFRGPHWPSVRSRAGG